MITGGHIRARRIRSACLRLCIEPSAGPAICCFEFPTRRTICARRTAVKVDSNPLSPNQRLRYVLSILSVTVKTAGFILGGLRGLYLPAFAVGWREFSDHRFCVRCPERDVGGIGLTFKGSASINLDALTEGAPFSASAGAKVDTTANRHGGGSTTRAHGLPVISVRIIAHWVYPMRRRFAFS